MLLLRSTAAQASLFLLLLFQFQHLNAQELHECGAAHVNNEVWAQHPEKRTLADELNREAETYTEEHYGQRNGNVRVIPVVFHIIHDYGSENLSKEELEYVIERGNEEFRRENIPVTSIAEDFQSVFADCEIEFRLARLDPDGNCTDGITRTVSDLTYSAGENVKQLIGWNTTKYLNVWVVNTLSSGAGGYAYYPGNAPSQSAEGIVLRAGQVATSFSHEVGHYLNLRHTWGNSNNNNEENNCFGDDLVQDTPNTIGSPGLGTCNLGQVTCSSLDNVQNHMDYSACGLMFTEGQKARMISALNSGVGGRNNLWQPNNLMATGTSEGFTNACVPTIDFLVNNTQGCEGLEVTFEDYSWGADIDETWEWDWSFEGGTPASSDEQNPTVVYNTSGTYDATLAITNSAGTNSRTIQNVVDVIPTGGGISEPYFEGMEESGFPNSSDPMFAWNVEGTGSPTWQRNTTASFSGNASARINLRSIPTDDIHNLISPPLDFSDLTNENASMTFRVAHANRTGTSHGERLRVYVSKDCGESWTLRYNKSGDGLNTAGGIVSGTFVPNANDWQEESISLVPVAGEEHVLVRFEARSDRQHYLYIDDINITPDASTGVGERIDLFNDVSIRPNPVNPNSVLSVTSDQAETITLSVIDVLGKQHATEQVRITAGTNNFELDRWTSVLSSGVHILLLESERGFQTVRFVVQ